MVKEQDKQAFTDDARRDSNPFRYRGRINNPEHVFGRDTELHEIIRVAGHGGNVVVSGPPRIGKSSLLTLVCDRLRRSVMAGDEPQALPRVSSMDIDTIPDDKALLRAIAATYGRSDLDDPTELAKFVESQTLDLDVYLCVDEYQEIFEPRFSNYLARYLRGLSQYPSLNLIVALDDYKVHLLQGDPRVTYCLNTFHPIHLSVFTERDVTSLVNHMLRGSHYQFTAEQIREICRITGCHPFKVQLACWHLYDELAQQSGTRWEELYQSEVRANPSLHRPWDIPDEIIRVIGLSLRKSFGKTRPEKEVDVADKIEIILRSAGFDARRETPEFLFSVKGYRPDFSLAEDSVAVEIKLCNRVSRVKKIVEEMGADIPSYQSRFSHIVFVIYDSGGHIDDVAGLVNDFEKIPGIRVVVCKH